MWIYIDRWFGSSGLTLNFPVGSTLAVVRNCASQNTSSFQSAPVPQNLSSPDSRRIRSPAAATREVRRTGFKCSGCGSCSRIWSANTLATTCPYILATTFWLALYTFPFCRSAPEERKGLSRAFHAFLLVSFWLGAVQIFNQNSPSVLYE